MSDELHERGMRVRREVLGDEHVDRADRPARRAFTADFQDLITRYAWGEIWARPGLDRRTRSAITITMLVALGREHELAMHVRAALRNGLTVDEMKEVLLQCAVYCGVPAANGAFAIAQRVLEEEEAREPRGDPVRGADADRPPRRRARRDAARRPRRARRARRRSSAPASTPDEIEDVFLGCANQAGEDNRNVARMAVLLAGLPQSVPGVTVNRLCASGLSAVVEACRAVVAGEGDLFVAGGVESMSRAPLALMKGDRPWARGNVVAYDTHLGWRFPNPRLEAMFPLESMGETGENVAERYGVSREEQDAFALRSQRALGGRAGRGPLRRRARPGRRRRRRRAPAAGHERREAGRAEAGVPRGRHASPPATRAGSTTAPPRSCRLRGEGPRARRRAARRVRRAAPPPASTRA